MAQTESLAYVFPESSFSFLLLDKLWDGYSVYWYPDLMDSEHVLEKYSPDKIWKSKGSKKVSIGHLALNTLYLNW